MRQIYDNDRNQRFLCMGYIEDIIRHGTIKINGERIRSFDDKVIGARDFFQNL